MVDDASLYSLYRRFSHFASQHYDTAKKARDRALEKRG